MRAVAVQFFVNGALFASFVPRLPEIRDRVGISVAGVGLLMSIAGMSSLVGSATVGPAIRRFGSKPVMLVAGALVSASLAVVGLATTPLLLAVGLTGMLLFDVLVDVAMNMQGSWLSARRHVPVMNRLHGLWSLGAVIGGVASSRIAAAGVSLSTHLVLAGAGLLAALGYVGPGLLAVDEHPEVDRQGEVDGGSDRRQPLGRALVLFGLAGFSAVAMESTSIEWSAFRLSDDFGSTAGVAALAYVAVTLGMTVGRFGGDWAIVRLGRWRLAQLSLALSGGGLVVASLVPNRFLVLAGFAGAGLGIATMLPGLYDTAARHQGRPGAGLGALTAGLRIAILVVPVSVGTLAGTDLSIGSAIAMVTLPCAVGFAFVTTRLHSTRRALPPSDGHG